MAKKKTAPAPKRTKPTLTWEEIGSGITIRKVPKFTGLTLPEEIAIIRSSKLPLPDTLDFAVMVAARFLDGQGIEYRPNGTYYTEDGRAHTFGQYVEAIGKRAYDSPVWYSAKIFQLWFLMRDAIAEGNAESASHLGFEIGRLHAEAKLKGKWEPNALSGKKTRALNKDKGKKGGAVKAKKAAPLHERIKARAAELRVESKKGKARILAREFPLSASRIERII